MLGRDHMPGFRLEENELEVLRGLTYGKPLYNCRIMNRVDFLRMTPRSPLKRLFWFPVLLSNFFSTAACGNGGNAPSISGASGTSQRSGGGAAPRSGMCAKEPMGADGIVRLSKIEVYPEYLGQYTRMVAEVG